MQHHWVAGPPKPVTGGRPHQLYFHLQGVHALLPLLALSSQPIDLLPQRAHGRLLQGTTQHTGTAAACCPPMAPACQQHPCSLTLEQPLPWGTTHAWSVGSCSGHTVGRGGSQTGPSGSAPTTTVAKHACRRATHLCSRLFHGLLDAGFLLLHVLHDRCRVLARRNRLLLTLPALQCK